MRLVLIEKRRRPDDDRYTWQRFELSEHFNERWWNEPRLFDDSATYFEVRLDGVEVARVELDDRVGFARDFGAPQLGAAALEIQFIEVAPAYRGRGIGTEVVTRIAALHPGCRLMALSEHADEFWSSLGWQRYERPERHLRGQPLYLQPP
ncbi:GNAT family N-acetyltransferase [Jiangella endophytica]|uniref:GNAT family N-acetyltransferase n=1 Tax=Jiangella endophytica TaxID=1623398 RepID=UPI0018E59891|nr:GNAT family N-acetyltransferase [Jiangella endophytica]